MPQLGLARGKQCWEQSKEGRGAPLCALVQVYLDLPISSLRCQLQLASGLGGSLLGRGLASAPYFLQSRSGVLGNSVKVGLV